MALCFTFGKAVKNKKQGIAIFMSMFIVLVLALGIVAYTEQIATPQLAQNGAVDLSMVDQAGGNMEGKETRFGIATIRDLGNLYDCCLQRLGQLQCTTAIRRSAV